MQLSCGLRVSEKKWVDGTRSRREVSEAFAKTFRGNRSRRREPASKKPPITFFFTDTLIILSRLPTFHDQIVSTTTRFHPLDGIFFKRPPANFLSRPRRFDRSTHFYFSTELPRLYELEFSAIYCLVVGWPMGRFRDCWIDSKYSSFEI